MQSWNSNQSQLLQSLNSLTTMLYWLYFALLRTLLMQVKEINLTNQAKKKNGVRTLKKSIGDILAYVMMKSIDYWMDLIQISNNATGMTTFFFQWVAKIAPEIHNYVYFIPVISGKESPSSTIPKIKDVLGRPLCLDHVSISEWITTADMEGRIQCSGRRDLRHVSRLWDSVTLTWMIWSFSQKRDYVTTRMGKNTGQEVIVHMSEDFFY